MKNNISCILVSTIVVLLVGYFATKITYDELKKQSFSIRTTATLSDLMKIEKKDFDDLQFSKSVFVFGSIAQLKNLEDMKHIKDWCPYLEEIDFNSIVKKIELRVQISAQQKNDFEEGYKKVSEYCKNGG